MLRFENAPNAPMFAARAYAVAAGSLGRSRAELRAEYVKSAIDGLRWAITSGTILAPLLPFAQDFAALRDDPDFVAVSRQPAAAVAGGSRQASSNRPTP